MSQRVVKFPLVFTHTRKAATDCVTHLALLRGGFALDRTCTVLTRGKQFVTRRKRPHQSLMSVRITPDAKHFSNGTRTMEFITQPAVMERAFEVVKEREEYILEQHG